MRWVAMVSYGAYKRRAATYRTSISISVARSGHLASQSRVKRPPPRPPARKQPSWRVFFSTLWAPPLAAADQYGNLTAIDRVHDRVERDA